MTATPLVTSVRPLHIIHPHGIAVQIEVAPGSSPW